VEKYIVKLLPEERNNLLVLLKKGKSKSRVLTHARVLLAADTSDLSKQYKSDEEISKELLVAKKTVKRIRKSFVEEGYEAALNRKKHSATRPRTFDGDKEAHLIALACNTPPEGRVRWTLKLLAKRVVELKVVEKASPATIGRVLKKRRLSHG
jgi:transposase